MATVVAINSDTTIFKTLGASIESSAKIRVNPVVLKLFKSTDLVNEVGTDANPLLFDPAEAGESTLHPDNPFLLYNDKDGAFDSVDAKNIGVEVFEMQLVDEHVGTSDGLANQVFSVAFPPVIAEDSNNPVQVLVGVTEWAEVDSFAGASNTDEVFVVDYELGTVTFGNGVNGAIPALGEEIYVTYSPATATFGIEARDDGWLGVQSTDVDANDRVVLLQPSSVLDTTHVQVAHVPLINTLGVQGVFLTSDPNRLATEYFAGGSYNDVTGVITLGTPLDPGVTEVLVDYTYTIADDSESLFTQLSRNVSHEFLNPIPSRNAKKINFQVVIPSGASPTNGVKVKFRLRITYTEV